MFRKRDIFYRNITYSVSVIKFYTYTIIQLTLKLTFSTQIVKNFLIKILLIQNQTTN